MSKTQKAFFAGILAIILGSGYLFILPRFIQGAEARVRGLEPLTARMFANMRPGDPVLVEGLISRENETRYRSLVAYRRSAPMQGPDKRTYWVDDDRVAPSLLIDLPDGQVRLEEDYLLLYANRGWQTKSFHYSGFDRGDKVIAVGTVTPDGRVKADFVASGTRQEYLLKRLGETWSAYIGGVCSIVLGFLFVVGSVMVWRAQARQRKLVLAGP